MPTPGTSCLFGGTDPSAGARDINNAIAMEAAENMGRVIGVTRSGVHLIPGSTQRPDNTFRRWNSPHGTVKRSFEVGFARSVPENPGQTTTQRRECGAAPRLYTLTRPADRGRTSGLTITAHTGHPGQTTGEVHLVGPKLGRSRCSLARPARNASSCGAPKREGRRRPGAGREVPRPQRGQVQQTGLCRVARRPIPQIEPGLRPPDRHC